MDLASLPLLAELTSRSPEETFTLGERLGAAIDAGAVVALVGELGTGKTLFTKGLARGLGVREHRRVSSPTFVIMQEYVGRLRIHHYDSYRLAGSADLAAVGFEEDLSAPDLVVVLEWADRAEDLLPAGVLALTFEHARDPASTAAGGRPPRASSTAGGRPPRASSTAGGRPPRASSTAGGCPPRASDSAAGASGTVRHLAFRGDPVRWGATVASLERLKN